MPNRKKTSTLTVPTCYALVQKRLVTRFKLKCFDIDFSVCPYNPSQPAESAKIALRLWHMITQPAFYETHVTNSLWL